MAELPEPYYQDDFVTLYHGDCRELLPHIEAEAVITDPPYGAGYYDTDANWLTPDDLAAFVASGRPTAIFGWPERLAALCVAAKCEPSEWICWHPTNARMRGFNLHGLWRESEHIAVFGVGRWDRLRQPRRPTTTPMPEVGKRIKGAAGMVRMGDVWTDESPNINPRQIHRRHHPNEKPVLVVGRLITAISEPGDTILDPFMGSGTTLRAAKDLGRKAIGIEIEERYCEIAAQRLAQDVLPLAVAGLPVEEGERDAA